MFICRSELYVLELNASIVVSEGIIKLWNHSLQYLEAELIKIIVVLGKLDFIIAFHNLGEQLCRAYYVHSIISSYYLLLTLGKGTIYLMVFQHIR